MKRFIVLVAVSLTLATLAAAPARAKDLYAILVTDTDAGGGIGPSVAKDKQNLKEVLEAAFRDHDMPGKLYLKVFDGKQARDKVVRDYIASLKGKVKPTDTVLFYYCGHGGESKKYGNQRFAFHHDGRFAPFCFYFEAEINRLQPKLKIMLYDCCADRPGPRAKDKERSRPRPRSGVSVNPKLFKQLFFEGNDWVIIAGTKRGDKSYGDESYGGYFTYTFVNSLGGEVRDFSDKKDGKVTWEKFFAEVKTRTNREIPNQTPEAHSLNERRANEYHLKFVNETNEAIKVRFRYLRGYETDQLVPSRFTKRWLEFEIPAHSEVVPQKGGEKLRVYAYQVDAVGEDSGKRWIHSQDPKLKDQNKSGARTINMGITYNAGKDGNKIRSWVHTLD